MIDMHTHSEYSHDSVCKTEDMYFAQKEQGTRFFAVTDHFDTHSYQDYDIFGPIRKSVETVKKLNQQYNTDGCILAGIEISEGFWHPEIYKKAMEAASYDVVIGSVHLVRHPNMDTAYSQIDFSHVSQDRIAQFLHTYFNDVFHMATQLDFDILAHLTCPLRYICGKYHKTVNLADYENKIKNILELIIRRGIALEVNTSSWNLLGDFMPPKNILEMYYHMGGERITLGSDAHVAEQAANCFDIAITELKQIGFRHIYYYQKRKPYAVAI